MHPKVVLIKIVRLYQRHLSPDQGWLRFVYPNNQGYCRMHPTCSEYMIASVEKYGLVRGVYRGLRRVFRCHPFQKKLIDIP